MAQFLLFEYRMERFLPEPSCNEGLWRVVLAGVFLFSSQKFVGRVVQFLLSGYHMEQSQFGQCCSVELLKMELAEVFPFSNQKFIGRVAQFHLFEYYKERFEQELLEVVEPKLDL